MRRNTRVVELGDELFAALDGLGAIGGRVRLLGCQDLGFVPWRFGHALICVAASCDSAPWFCGWEWRRFMANAENLGNDP